MDRCRCYLCEKLCYCDSNQYEKCQYRISKSFGSLENRAYEEACTRLAVKFARKHNWRFEGWVGFFSPEKSNWYEGAGGHAIISGDVYSMEDIRADLMMDAPEDSISTYMDECVEEGFAAMKEEREPRYVNYRNWLLGARVKPEDCSEEYKEIERKRIIESSNRMEAAKKELTQMLDNMTEDQDMF